eukprot:scaffold118773_cov28-Tisochrysis_lutea.AAC.1
MCCHTCVIDRARSVANSLRVASRFAPWPSNNRNHNALVCASGDSWGRDERGLVVGSPSLTKAK